LSGAAPASRSVGLAHCGWISCLKVLCLRLGV
jgi:hypothetical protein